MPDLADLLARLKKRYGAPVPPPAKGPFELILWENACYLLPDTRRAEVFESLREQVGLDPKKILDAPQSALRPLAKRGGMRPETRVIRWREIARIALDQFDGDLNVLLKLPYKEAKSALKQFPNLGDPAAEKILLYSGIVGHLPLESNGLRVLTRFGFGREQKSYGAAYRSVQEAIANHLPRGRKALVHAHLLLRDHGQTLCKRNDPMCGDCPVADSCAFSLAGSSRTR